MGYERVLDDDRKEETKIILRLQGDVETWKRRAATV